MRRRTVDFRWEDEAAQDVFREWVPFPDEEATVKEVERMEALAGLVPPLRVLDVGCGNGRHAVAFARRGYAVAGIDVARRFLAEAEALATQAGVDVELRHQRASTLEERDAFDFALAYWHTIGFMSEEEIRRHFGCIHAALKPGCTFVYVFQGPKLAPGGEDTAPVKNWGEREGKFMLSERRIRGGYRDEHCIVIDTVEGEIVDVREHQRAFALFQVLDYLDGAGFSDVAAYRDLDQNPAGADDFSVFVCRK